MLKINKLVILICLAGTSFSMEDQIDNSHAQLGISTAQLLKQKPYRDEDLAQLATYKTELEWGGLGKNCARSEEYISDISRIASESTLTINNDPNADSDLAGDLFKSDEILRQYPSLKIEFKEKFNEVKMGHISTNIFEELDVWTRVASHIANPSNPNKQELAINLLVTSLVNEFKWQINFLKPTGKFTYQTQILDFHKMVNEVGIHPKLMPKQRKLGGNSVAVKTDPLLHPSQKELVRYETPFDLTPQAEKFPLLGIYKKFYDLLGLKDFKAELIVVSDHAYNAKLKENKLKNQPIGHLAYLQITGIK